MDESDLVFSRLCQHVTEDGMTVEVCIYSSGKNDWILEVVNEANTSIVWDEEFVTDEAAFREFKRTVEEEGIRSFSESAA